MRLESWIIKATDKHSEYIVLIVFPRQQRLRESVSMLRYTHIVFRVSDLVGRQLYVAGVLFYVIWTLQSLEAALCITEFGITKLYIIPTKYFHMFWMALGTKSDYFITQLKHSGVCNRENQQDAKDVYF